MSLNQDLETATKSWLTLVSGASLGLGPAKAASRQFSSLSCHTWNRSTGGGEPCLQQLSPGHCRPLASGPAAFAEPFAPSAGRGKRGAWDVQATWLPPW